MARIQRPGEDPAPTDPAKRERDRQRNRNRNRNRGRGNGLAGGTGATGGGATSPGTTPGTTTAFAIQDPGAWARSNMVAAGMSAVNSATPYGEFLNSAVVQPFVSGWQEWKASHPTTSDQDFWNYARGTGQGLPDAVTGGPPAAPGAAAPEVMGFNAFTQQETGKGPKQFNKHRRNRLRGQYDTYVAGQQPTGTPQAVPSTLAPADWAAYQAYMQNEIDKYTPQQQGRYDQGKRPGSIRTNLFS